MRLNWPAVWPQPPKGWTPPPGWKPDPSWPRAPRGWQLWLDDHTTGPAQQTDVSGDAAPDAWEAEAVGSRTPGPPHSLAERQEIVALRSRVSQLESLLRSQQESVEEVIELSDQRVLQDAGIYRYHHPLENAAAYKVRLRELESQIDAMVKDRRAVLASDLFTFQGSLAKGRRMVSDLSRLMLRAYNAEAENCVRSLRSGNAITATGRLVKAMNSVERLGSLIELRINPDYHALRVLELELVADYQMRRQEEREAARHEREMLREQRRAEAELAEEKARLVKERAHYVAALESLATAEDASGAEELRLRLAEIDLAIEANDYRIANIRAGYVYVISNVGAFGAKIVKIGLTRRLEPRNRIRELSNASVPFPYDTHALFFSDDAVSLENELHKAFAHRRVNVVNARREFFFASSEEVREVLDQKVGGLLEYVEEPAAPEYFQSRSSWPQIE